MSSAGTRHSAKRPRESWVKNYTKQGQGHSGLDRCLRRHGAGNLNALKPQEPQPVHKAFKSYEPGYVHMDVKYQIGRAHV